MPKQRGYPDRRGMGAQSDFLSETFIPSDGHRAAQISRAKALLATGLPAEQAAAMLSLSVEDIVPAEGPGRPHRTKDTTESR